MEVCKHNQVGFCKFGGKCNKKHDNEICQRRKDCTISSCSKRHPKNCRYFCQNGSCKFGETCAYIHTDDKNNTKVEELEKEVKKLTETVGYLEKEVDELKEEVKFLKRVMGKMVKSLKSLEGEQEVES